MIEGRKGLLVSGGRKHSWESSALPSADEENILGNVALSPPAEEKDILASVALSPPAEEKDILASVALPYVVTLDHPIPPFLYPSLEIGRAHV